eukprot:COSAG02_NODE_1140_length_14275_cov_154.904557_6_plen_355_part_00
MSSTLNVAILGADSTTCSDERARGNRGRLLAKFGSKGRKAGGGGDGSAVAPKAQSFPPEMLAELGLHTNESGELEKTEPQLSPPGGCSREALVGASAATRKPFGDITNGGANTKRLGKERQGRTTYGSNGPKAGGDDSSVVAPEAQSFPPDMLAELGLHTNESGELEKTEPRLSPPVGCSREALVTTYTAYPSYILGAGSGCLGCCEFWKGYVVTVPAGSCGATGKGCCCCCGATAVSTHAKSFPCCDPAGHVLWSNAWRNLTHIEYDMCGSCDCCSCCGCHCCNCCHCCSCQHCGPTYVSCGPMYTWAVPCLVGCCVCCAAAHYCDPHKPCGDLDLDQHGKSLKLRCHDMNRG